MHQLEELRSAIEMEFGEQVTEQPVSGTAVVFCSSMWAYKVRGLLPSLSPGVSFAKSQSLTRREFRRLATFGEDAPGAELHPLLVEARSLNVLRTEKLSPIALVGGGAMQRADQIALGAVEVLEARKRAPEPLATSAQPVDHLRQMVNQLEGVIDREVERRARSIAIEVESMPTDDWRWILHGDLRFANLGMKNGRLRLFDPSVLPHLYTTSWCRELASLWASFISTTNVVPEWSSLLSIRPLGDFDPFRTWVSFNLIHRALLECIFSLRCHPGSARPTALRVTLDQLDQLGD